MRNQCHRQRIPSTVQLNLEPVRKEPMRQDNIPVGCIPPAFVVRGDDVTSCLVPFFFRRRGRVSVPRWCMFPEGGLFPGVC